MGAGLLGSPGAPPPTGGAVLLGGGALSAAGAVRGPRGSGAPSSLETAAPPALEAQSSTPAGHLTFQRDRGPHRPSQDAGREGHGGCVPCSWA